MISKLPIRPANDVLASESVILNALTKLRSGDDHVFELRALDVPVRLGSPITVAGWFDDLDAMAREAVKLDQRGAQVYLTLNPVHPALLCRAHNRIIERPKATTADRDILRRVWIPIDIDPVRPSGVSSSDNELAVAKDRATRVADFLTEKLGEPPAIWACSGNGYHLLFRTDLQNNDKNTAHVKGLINQTADKFSDDAVSIDRTVFNAARIWRLYGTMNRKGDSVPKLHRVHRRAAILSTSTAGLISPEKLAASFPIDLDKPVTVRNSTAPSNIGASPESLKAYLESHNLKVVVTKTTPGKRVFVLDRCPMNPEHGGDKSAAVLWSDGRIGFKCHHNSCKPYGWKDVRAKIDSHYQGNGPRSHQSRGGAWRHISIPLEPETTTGDEVRQEAER